MKTMPATSAIALDSVSKSYGRGESAVRALGDVSIDLTSESFTTIMELKDGSEVEIRPIEPDDIGSLAEGLEELSVNSRYRRFLSPKRSFSSSELHYLTSIDHSTHEALIAQEPGTAHGLGVVRFVKDAADPTRAEIAIVVTDAWQGRGLGTVLLSCVTKRAVQEGVRQFSATVLESNRDIVALLRKIGPLEVHHAGDGVAELTIHLDKGRTRPTVAASRMTALGA